MTALHFEKPPKPLRLTMAFLKRTVSVQVDQRPMLMYSYIRKGIRRGREGILPAICRGRDARAPLPALFLLSFLCVFWMKAPERLQRTFERAGDSLQEVNARGRKAYKSGGGGE